MASSRKSSRSRTASSDLVARVAAQLKSIVRPSDRLVAGLSGGIDSVVLLDIRMPAMSGIEVARHLSLLDSPPAVIFTTAYDQYALEAFDSHAVGYLLKPVRRERLEGALAHAARLGNALLSELGRSTKGFERRRHIAARVRDELRLIPLGEIRLLKAEQKYVSVFHAGGEDLIEDSLR